MRIAVLVAALICIVIAVTKYQNYNEGAAIYNESASKSKPRK